MSDEKNTAPKRKPKGKQKPKRKTPEITGRSRSFEEQKWKPGQSGNPSGRPRVVGELRDIARTYTMEAIETLAKVMRDPDAPAAARVAAVAHILDRGYGKPTQHVSQTVRHIKEMTDAELLEFIAGAHEEDGGDGADAPPLN